MQKLELKFHLIGGTVVTVPNPDLTLDDVADQLSEYGSISVSSPNGEETLIFRRAVAAICMSHGLPN